MGFKLGTNRGNHAVSGEIKTKMRFGKQSGGEGSIPGTPIMRVPLEEGVMGEANMDGSIYVNENIIPGEKKTPIYKKSSGFKMKSSPAKIYSKPKGKRTKY